VSTSIGVDKPDPRCGVVRPDETTAGVGKAGGTNVSSYRDPGGALRPGAKRFDPRCGEERPDETVLEELSEGKTGPACWVI